VGVPAVNAPLAKGDSMRTILAFAILGISFALVGACSSSDADRPASAGSSCPDGGLPDAAVEPVSCANWIQRLIDCQVIAGHRVSGCVEDDPILPCAWACMQNATCTQIKASYCNNSFNGYAGCINECNQMPLMYTCDDGSKIELLRTCDGIPDCPNGDDETDCTTGYFTCKGGQNIPQKWVCDGVVDCPSGEDEAGCPAGPMYTCDTGESLPADRECNGFKDCPNGEDETDCASLTCE
jgi:hypothetical protein